MVAAITEAGGRAVANGADVADFEQAAAMVQQAIDEFGGLDILVNNAGFVRDRMLVNTSEEEWDAVIRVHLKGHFAPLRHAGAYWRTESKEGRQRAARVINTSSGAGLQGSVGQATYSAAKAGIAGLTLVAAPGAGPLRRHGQRDRAVARTRMTEGAFDTSAMALPEDNSPLVAWLASEEAGDVTGRVIEIDGGTITVETRLGARTLPRQRRPLGRGRRRPGAARAARRGARTRSRSTAPERSGTEAACRRPPARTGRRDAAGEGAVGAVGREVRHLVAQDREPDEPHPGRAGGRRQGTR